MSSIKLRLQLSSDLPCSAHKGWTEARLLCPAGDIEQELLDIMLHETLGQTDFTQIPAPGLYEDIRANAAILDYGKYADGCFPLVVCESAIDTARSRMKNAL